MGNILQDEYISVMRIHFSAGINIFCTEINIVVLKKIVL